MTVITSMRVSGLGVRNIASFEYSQHSLHFLPAEVTVSASYFTPKELKFYVNPCMQYLAYYVHIKNMVEHKKFKFVNLNYLLNFMG